MTGSVDVVLRKIAKLEKSNNGPAALEVLEDAILQFPDNPRLAKRHQSLRKDIIASEVGENPPPEVLRKLNFYTENANWHALTTACSMLLEVHPVSVALWNFKAVGERETGALEQSEVSLKKAISINRNVAATYVNLGNTLKEQGRIDEAINQLKIGLKIDPNRAQGLNALGNCLQELGQFDEARRMFEKALQEDPKLTEARYNLGGVRLQNCEFETAWDLRESRWDRPDFKAQRAKYPQMQWSGSKVDRLLVWAEQGIGDEIMFASCLNELASYANKLIVSVTGRSKPLFERSFPNITFVDRDQTITPAHYDHHVPAMTAIGILRKSADSFAGASFPYLQPDKKRMRGLREELVETAGDKQIIGISWFSKARLVGKKRSIALEKLAAHLPSDALLVSLQYGDIDEELKRLETDFGCHVYNVSSVDTFNDLDGFAALVGACDRVVSVDNSTVHFAGALNKECDVLLPYNADWRWGRKGNETTLWYGSLRLHWQEALGEWDGCLEGLSRR